MPYKSAAQQHIESLQAELRARDALLAETLNAQARANVEAAKQKAEAERNSAIEAEREKARSAAWKLHNFDVAVKERPDQPLDWSAIDAVPQHGWPTVEAEEAWCESHPSTAAAVADVARTSISETRLGKMLRELEAGRVRLEKV